MRIQCGSKLSLTNKLRTGILAAGLAAALGTSACESTGEGGDEALLGILLMGAGIQQNKPAISAVGRGMVDYGAAKAGKSEVNVNVGGSNLCPGGSRTHTFKDSYGRMHAAYINTINGKWITCEVGTNKVLHNPF